MTTGPSYLTKCTLCSVVQGGADDYDDEEDAINNEEEVEQESNNPREEQYQRGPGDSREFFKK